MRVRHGVETYPVFLRDLSMAVFSDVGATHFDGPLTDLEEALRVGAGVELRLGLNLFFGLDVDMRLGYSRGFSEFGEDQVYILMAPAP
ncbi:MAG: hypothetical protein ACI9MR_004599 [Myxococcota bacterium]